MHAPRIPKTESSRLNELYSYHILDTLPEEEFDDFTKIAAQICDVPIALISLVDKDRQWFKSKQGLEAPETSREVSFCGHAINEPLELLEVSDSREDPRFADNPLVVGDPRVIFYLGAPLVSPKGEAIGTLCVIDHKPRTLSTETKAALKLLATQVITKLELRKHNAELEAINQQLQVEVELRKKKEQELLEERDRAIEAERYKDQFLSNISHEIRTPLNGIVGITQLLLADGNLTKPHLESLKDIDFSANHLLHIINDILDLNKIKQPNFNFEQIAFNFSQFIENIRKVLAVNAAQKGIDLVVKMDPEIPAVVIGDSIRLGQILLNIIGNAIKFTERGVVRFAVQLMNTPNPEMVMLKFKICDTGIGIPKEQLAHIFDPFTQSDTSISRKYGGTGLGLAISKNLIEQFGGTIEVESKVGEGSSFIFNIRLNKSNEGGRSIPMEGNAGIPSAKTSNETIRILVAEDNVINQKVAKRHLEKYGFVVDVVENGTQVLKQLQDTAYDLILMDVNMPIMDGFETTLNIRNAHHPYKDIKIIAWTASVLNAQKNKYFEAGMNDIAPKPFKPKELVQKIMKLTQPEKR